MKIEEVRTSFTVYLIASQLEQMGGVAEALRLAGYMTVSFSELSQAFSEFPSNPPHFLLFDAREKNFNLKKAIKQVVLQLPESHVFLLVDFKEREKVMPMLEDGVYALIYMPLIAPVELIQAIDRAAERDYFMYMNERLAEAAHHEPPPEISENSDVHPLPPIPEHTATQTKSQTSDLHLDFARKLFEQRGADEAIETYLSEASMVLNSAGVLYMKYLPNRRVLIAGSGKNINVDLGGLGVDFNAAKGTFRVAQLRTPKEIPDLANMVEEVFGVSDFFAEPVEALGEVQGICVYLAPEPDGAQSAALENASALLGKALSLIESEKRMHVMNIKDPATEMLNRQNFISRIGQEISRSRRTLLPVALAVVACDQYGQIVSKLGHEDAQALLRMVAKIIERHSRVNDIVGRTGADEFGLLLPHTDRRGALIKVERLRRMIESADFSKVLKEFPNITVSIGVAEYPSMVRDAEELFSSADEALYQVRGVGNRTCVSKAPDGFVADFEVAAKESF